MAQTKASLIDLNSNELILDLDGDTTLHSSTDDQIDIKIAGADDFTFTAGAFNILASSHAVFADSSEAKFGAGTDLQIYHDGTNSFIANKTGALKIATETSGIAITIGHTTSEVTVADNLTVTGNANIGGTLTFADGSIALADLDIDGATDIGAAIVDADLFIIDDGAGGTNRKVAASRIKTYIGSTTAVDDLTLGDAAVTIATSSGNITIDAQAGDTDIIFKGTDSSSDITALTLDMSDAGTAVFNHDIRIADDGQIGSASDADAIVINSSGVVTMNQIPVFSAGLNVSGGTIAGTLSTAAQTNITSVGALGGGSIASGFGAIDNGASNITSGGLLKLDVDADADDVTGDSATGRLTIGAGEDLNLYHGGTNSYIVNDTGDLIIDSAVEIQLDADGGDIILKDNGTEFGRLSNSSTDFVVKSAVSDKDLIFKGNDGGSEITALTLDMSAAGDATFNNQVIIGDGKLVLNSTAVTSTAAELNLLDGVSGLVQADLTKLAAVDATASELNITQGSNSATSTTVADADRVVMNDNGTMVQVAVTDLAAYFDDEITAMPNLITVGATGTATSVAGIPFFSDISNNSIYTHDVSGTDNTAEGNTAFGVGALDAITTGDYNTAVGFGALSAHQTGEGNVAVGQAALNANTDANNLAVGKSALLSNTSGTRNIAIGNRTNDLADTENDNLAIGYEAMTGAVAGGEYNVAIGNYAMDALTSGDNNVALGYNAGGALTTGGGNVLIGRDTGDALTDDSQSTLVGAYAGSQATVGQLTALGYGALNGVTSGTRNTAVGYDCGNSFDAEDDNTFMGYAAGSGPINGAEYNVGIGNYVLDALTSADYTTAVGYDAGGAVTSGGYNTLIGHQAGHAITSGNTNTAVGHHSLGTNTVGDRNTAVGSGALGTFNPSSNTDDNNTAVGYGAANALTTGVHNIAIGGNALGGDPGPTTEDHNLAIGVGSMSGNINGGTYNVMVGNNTGDAITSGDSNTGVGYNTQTNVTTGSNNTSLGDDAMNDIDTGSGNVNIGDGTGNGSNTNHSIVIGQAAQGKGSNTGFISPNGGAVYQGNNSSAWSTTSDRRIKKNIEDNNIGLEKINKIKVRNFEYRLPEEITELPSHAAIKKEGVQVGAIAQEIQEVLPDTVVQTTHGVYSVNPDNITWYLVNAVQELSSQVEELKDKIKVLEG